MILFMGMLVSKAHKDTIWIQQPPNQAGTLLVSDPVIFKIALKLEYSPLYPWHGWWITKWRGQLLFSQDACP